MRGETLSRHDLVALAPGVPDPLPDTVPGAARQAWRKAGRPLIVRRGSRADGIPLGLPLPPAMGKARIALCLQPDALVPHAPPGADELRAAAPDAWQGTLRDAEALARAHGVTLTAFGALLWQALTGLDYLHAGSDLDLLWRCPDAMPADLPCAIADLDGRAAMRLDGEIVVNGWGVQWRELAMAGRDDAVLCRHADGIAMRPAGTFAVTRAA